MLLCNRVNRTATMLAAAMVFGALVSRACGTEETSNFYLPEGLESHVWARSPMFYNPTNIDVDHRGRVWVVESVNYRHAKRKHPDQLWHDQGDRVMVLEDSDGDGRADKSSVFVQDPELVAPLGIAVFDNQVLVSCSPSLLLYTDVDRNGRFDPAVDRKEKLLTGFGGYNGDHSLHAAVSGPDGLWYLVAGNAGPHIVTDRSGWTLRAFSGGKPGELGPKSDDGRVWIGGVALRIRPDGTGLTVIGHNSRNCYEICVDSQGNVFQNDNDDTISCRTTWLMEYGSTGYYSADGRRSWQADQRPGQSIPTAHWRQDDPGVIPAGDVYGPGAPTGIAFYENGSLGAKYAGLLLSCEAGRNVIWGYYPQVSGAGLNLNRMAFFSSVTEDDPHYRWQDRPADTRKWFRPSDVCVGADGAIYVADWFDPVVGGGQMDDKQASGTIYRIVAKGTNPPTPSIDLATAEGHLAALASPANNVRYVGFTRLAAQGEAALSRIEPWLSGEDRFLASRAAFLAAQLGPAGQQRIEQWFVAKDEQKRLIAFRALRRAGVDMVPLAERLCRDPAPTVRREVALALRDVPVERCLNILLALAEGYDGSDRWYLEALGTGCEGKEATVYAALLARTNAEPKAWDDRLAAIIWRLHPTDAISALQQRALAETLSPAARRKMIDAIAFIPGVAAAQVMDQIATHGPSDLRDYARFWLERPCHEDWRKFVRAATSRDDAPLAATVKVKLPKEPAYQSEVIAPGRTADIDVDITGAKHLYLVAADAGDGNSCDWADWVDPRLVGPEVELPLTSLPWKQAIAGWGETLVNKNCRQLPLSVTGHTVTGGIGTHAPSIIVYELPQGCPSRFRAKVGLDDGGADLGGALHRSHKASVVFRVYHDGTTMPTERANQLVLRLQEAALSAAERAETIRQLSLFKEGGLQLVAMASQGRLSEELKAVVAEHIHQNPDIAVRAIAGEHFPRKLTGEGSLPAIANLANLRGDALRGRDLFLGKGNCSRCHRVGGQGASVGPDLTEIRRKFDRTQLLDAIVNPSAAILLGYEAWIISTVDGRVITGILVGQGDPLIVVNTEGNQQVIPQNQVEDRRRISVSIMPEVGVLGLRPQDLADLAEYLINRPSEPGQP